ncbi:MAG: YitT family protein [Candidatus Cloacimonetes bacterium]|nr:YitT family protein [Candidatus Cloacimonadota bacterium]
MKKKRIRIESLFQFLVPIFTGFLYAVAIKYFIRPSTVIMTGTEGLSLATSYYLDSEFSFVVFYSAFQFILVMFSFFKIGIKFSIKTLMTVSSVSAFILILPMIKFASPEPENERLVLVLFGSIIAGIAKALSLKNRGSVGDEDIIAVYFSEKLRKPVGKIIISAGLISMVYGLVLAYLKTESISYVANTLIYTTIFIFVSAETVNAIYRRYKYSRVTINVDKIDQISSVISHIFPERSFTISDVEGSFSGSNRKQITLILSQEEMPVLLNSLNSIDEKFFLYYNQVDGIVGRFMYSKF